MSETTRRELEDARRELERRDGEIERLRGILVTRDRELGAAKGRLAWIESMARPLFGVPRRLKRGMARARRALESIAASASRGGK